MSCSSFIPSTGFVEIYFVFENINVEISQRHSGVVFGHIYRHVHMLSVTRHLTLWTTNTSYSSRIPIDTLNNFFAVYAVFLIMIVVGCCPS